jgi:magnesium-transporting ATPase (P-type)
MLAGNANTTINQMILDDINVPQERESNRANLDKFDGVDGMLKALGTSVENGLSDEQVLEMRARFGTNDFPESPFDSFFSMLLEALTDTTLLILLAAAAISLVIGAIEDPGHGWIEGGAIFIAVFLVANITAGNDYSKQLQFRALEASSAKSERCSVLRGGSIQRVNPNDLVVGDIIVLQVCASFSRAVLLNSA